MKSPPDKDYLRAGALAARDGLGAAQRDAAARAIAAHAVAADGLPLERPPGVIVAGFCAIRSEIDPLPLMQRLADRGAALALPVATGRGQPLKFRSWTPGAALVRGAYGIFEPSSDAEEVEPDIVLVPLAAFDRAGHRIGYGAGYYDRTLHRLRALRRITAIGVAFAVQEIAFVPASEHDERLDLVLTEQEIIDLRGLL